MFIPYSLFASHRNRINDVISYIGSTLNSEGLPQHGGKLGAEGMDAVPVLLDGLREGEQGQHADRE